MSEISHSNNSDDVLSISNMAAFATNSDQLISRLIPEHFKRDDDVEVFITSCNRYFKAAGVPDNLKETLVVTLLLRELIPVYENTRSSERGFENRLREAFQKKDPKWMF